MSNNNDEVNSDDNSVAVNAVCSDYDSTVNISKDQTSISKVRKNVVSKAIDFLVLESVRKMPADRKINFLRNKGLTEFEIQYSIQRAAIICYDNQSLNNQNPPSVHHNLSNAPGAIQTSFESQSWYSRLFGPIAFAAAVIYIGYKLYKKYIENWLFGAQKSTLENRLETIELSIQKCIMMLEEKDNVHKSSIAFAERQKESNLQLRTDLKSIKSLLLNRFQFPPAPASTTIPQWQLPKNTKPKIEPQKKISSSDKPTSLQTSENNINSSDKPNSLQTSENKINSSDKPNSLQTSENKINSSDKPNSLQTSEKKKLNETQKNQVVDLELNDLTDNDNDKDCVIINSTSDETPLSTSSDQNPIISRNVDDENDSEHNENNGGINQ